MFRALFGAHVVPATPCGRSYSRLGSACTILDCLALGSALSLRSYSRLGSALTVRLASSEGESTVWRDGST